MVSAKARLCLVEAFIVEHADALIIPYSHDNTKRLQSLLLAKYLYFITGG